jgi:hypothetical protein
MSLPPHIEQRADSLGRVYYVDHLRKTSSWVLPNDVLVTPPPVPSRETRPVLSGEFSPLSRPLTPPAAPLKRVSLQQIPFAPAPAPAPSASQRCQKVGVEMQHIAQSVDLGVLSSRMGFEALERCTSDLEALKVSGGRDPRFNDELMKTVAVGEVVANKLVAKQQVEAYCEELQKLHIAINALEERVDRLDRGARNFEEMTSSLAFVVQQFTKIKERAPTALLDEPTLAYERKIGYLLSSLSESIAQLERRASHHTLARAETRVMSPPAEAPSVPMLRRTTESMPVLKVFVEKNNVCFLLFLFFDVSDC